jgi:hypothetical protein
MATVKPQVPFVRLLGYVRDDGSYPRLEARVSVALTNNRICEIFEEERKRTVASKP